MKLGTLIHTYNYFVHAKFQPPGSYGSAVTAGQLGLRPSFLCPHLRASPNSKFKSPLWLSDKCCAHGTRHTASYLHLVYLCETSTPWVAGFS